MYTKAIFILCALALFIQCAFSQYASFAAMDATPYGFISPALGPCLTASNFAAPGFGTPAFARSAYAAGPALAYDGLAYPGVDYASRSRAYDGLYASAMEFTATTGGGLIVTSASPIAPTGISIVSENAFEGILSMAGDVPFVGSTGMEGVLPTIGTGAINHACGNGLTVMISEASIAPIAGLAPGATISPAITISPTVAITPAMTISPGLAPVAAYCGCDSPFMY